ELEEPPRAPPIRGADVVEQVVLDQDPPGLPAGEIVVRGEDVEPAPGVTEDVLPERHVLDRAPRCSTVLVPDGEEDGEPILVVLPVVFEEVALREHAAGVLQLEDVLDRPRLSGIGRVPDLPDRKNTRLNSSHVSI